MSAAQQTNLSLYNIETGLLDLLRYREELASDPDITPQETTASLDAVDAQIQEYVTREVQKVDGIAAFLRECETRATALKIEAQRVRSQAAMWEQRESRLREITLNVMQMVGAKELDGTNSTLKVRKNPPSVDVAQPELVPAPYQRITVTMSKYLYDRINQALFSGDKTSSLFVELQECKTGPIEAVKSKIAEELKQGVGVPGCRLREDSVRLVVE